MRIKYFIFISYNSVQCSYFNRLNQTDMGEANLHNYKLLNGGFFLQLNFLLRILWMIEISIENVEEDTIYVVIACFQNKSLHTQCKDIPGYLPWKILYNFIPSTNCTEDNPREQSTGILLQNFIKVGSEWLIDYGLHYTIVTYDLTHWCVST